jgi:hypothetical protein
VCKFHTDSQTRKNLFSCKEEIKVLPYNHYLPLLFSPPGCETIELVIGRLGNIFINV